MKAKYYLARMLGGYLQFSDDYWTNYKDAIRSRSRQVNPSQWFIVINLDLHPQSKRINLESAKITQEQLINEAKRMMKETLDIMRKLTD